MMKTADDSCATAHIGSIKPVLELTTPIKYLKHISERIASAFATRGVVACLLILLCAAHVNAQQAQNPSPMVEHTRKHPRLTQTTPPGLRQKLTLGTLFVPEKLKGKRHVNLLLFFHGGDWLPELAVAQQRKMAVITVQAGAGSSTYEKLFVDPATFPKLLAEAQAAAGVTFSEIEFAGWSAGCGALRQILRDPASYDRVSRVLCIDGVHAGYLNGAPAAAEPQLEPSNLQSWLRFGTDAIAGKKHLIITHSEIFPGTYASTTETADYLLRQWGLTPHPVVRWGPMGTQMLSETKAGGLLVVGFAGNSAPDHVDQLQSLPEYLRWLSKK
ncbi:MAG TPA: hypothetical protein VF865_19035 [Acidobacteriaceae bacterium]